MAGFSNEVVYGINVDFTGNTQVEPQILNDGELLIGSSVAPNIRVGHIVSSDSYITVTNQNGQIDLTQGGAGADVIGPATSTDNALVRWDGTTGKLVQNSVGILDDSGNLSGIGTLAAAGNVTFSRSSSGSAVDTNIFNTSNTANSHAQQTITVGGSSGGDGKLLFTVSGVAVRWHVALDNTDGTNDDVFTIGQTASVGSSRELTITLSSVLKMHNGIAVKVTSTAVSYNVLVTDYIIAVTDNSAARTISLPAAPTTGQVFIIKDAAGTAGAPNNITIDTVGAELIDGEASTTINNAYGSITVYFNGTNYFII